MREIDEAVFWDGDFQPGDPWFEQMKWHVDATQQLFWERAMIDPI